MRKWTNLVYTAMDEGMLSPKAIAEMCLAYMSEDDVEDMCRSNDLCNFLEPEDEDADYDDSMDGDFDSGMASAGFGMNEDYGYAGDD